MFGKVDKQGAPFEWSRIENFTPIFKDEDEEKLTPVLAKYIPLEVCLAEWFLWMDPSKIVKEMKPEFVTYLRYEDDSKERVLSDWQSSDYALE